MCLNPVSIPNPVRRLGIRKSDVSNRLQSYMTLRQRSAEPKTILVPCGHCEQCLASKMSEYRRRMQFELEQSPRNRRSFFLTLTFDDEHLADIHESKDLRVLFRNFLRRVNYYFFGDTKVDHTPYFCASEFGDRFTERLHLHCVLYNLPIPQYFGLGLVNTIISSLWQCGHTWTGWFNGKSIKYISKYVLKSYELYESNLHMVLCSQLLGFRQKFVDAYVKFKDFRTFCCNYPRNKYKTFVFPLKCETRKIKELLTGEQLYNLRIYIYKLISQILEEEKYINLIKKQVKNLCRHYLLSFGQKSRKCLRSICPEELSPPLELTQLCPCL